MEGVAIRGTSGVNGALAEQSVSSWRAAVNTTMFGGATVLLQDALQRN